jgi:hypothetical protein
MPGEGPSNGEHRSRLRAPARVYERERLGPGLTRACLGRIAALRFALDGAAASTRQGSRVVAVRRPCDPWQPITWPLVTASLTAGLAGVVTPSPSAGPNAGTTQAAIAVARRVGEDAGGDRQERVHRALIRVTQDAVRGREAPQGLFAPMPNLVWDFTGAIADQFGETVMMLPAVRDANRARLLDEVSGPVEISLDAIAGGIRGEFSDMPPCTSAEIAQSS